MRTFLLLSAAALLLTGAGAAWSSLGKGDALDSVSGGGTFGPGTFDGPIGLTFALRRDLSIDAHGGPHGENPTGLVYYGRNDANAGVTPARDVQCMRVDANTAVLGGTYIQGTELWGWTIRFEDNGPPGQGPRDKSSALFIDPLSAAIWPAGFPTVCPALDASVFVANGYLPLHGGDVVVHDGGR